MKLFFHSIALVFILFSLCVARINILFTSNTVIHQYSLDSYYSSLGHAPKKSPILARTTFITEQNVLNDCEFQGIDDIVITGRVLIFIGKLPPFYGCNRHLGGLAVAFARMAQNKGAIAAVIKQTEKFSEGRMTGVTEDIEIPIIVVPAHSMDFLIANKSAIVAFELPVISSHENNEIRRLVREYNALRYTGAAVYFISTMLLTYILYLDLERLHQRNKKISHNVVMKVFAVAACFASFVWLIVDPFYFEAIDGWYPYMCMKIHTGFFAIDFILILRLCGKVANKATKTLIPYRGLLYVVYPLIAIMLVVTFWSGIWWHHNVGIQVFYYSQIVVLATCGVGFLLYGKDIWSILRRSGNSSPGKNVLPVRLIGFICCYLLEVYTGNVLNLSGALGLIFGLLFNFLLNGLGFIIIFLILFFQPIKSKQTFIGGQTPAPSPTASGNMS